MVSILQWLKKWSERSEVAFETAIHIESIDRLRLRLRTKLVLIAVLCGGLFALGMALLDRTRSTA